MEVDEQEVKFPGTNFDEVIDVVQVITLKNDLSSYLFPCDYLGFFFLLYFFSSAFRFIESKKVFSHLFYPTCTYPPSLINTPCGGNT